tara:strand:+ start:910 stop:1371 length:462 start_codon:yes stop_codon:yes gene_type:complete
MKKTLYIPLIAVLVILASIAFAGDLFTSITSSYGPSHRTQANAALDALEDNIVGTATAVSVTNGQALTVSAPVYVISGIGGADNSTNTITLVASTIAGKKVTFLVATASSNLIQFADSGTVAASGAILLDGNDTAVLQAVDTSTWCLISESDN